MYVLSPLPVVVFDRWSRWHRLAMLVSLLIFVLGNWAVARRIVGHPEMFPKPATMQPRQFPEARSHYAMRALPIANVALGLVVLTALLLGRL